MKSVDQHAGWRKLDLDEKRLLQYLPLFPSLSACARTIGKNGDWLRNRRRKRYFREMIALRQFQRTGSIPSFDEEIRLYCQMMLDLIAEFETDQKVRAMAARALKRR